MSVAVLALGVVAVLLVAGLVTTPLALGRRRRRSALDAPPVPDVSPAPAPDVNPAPVHDAAAELAATLKATVRRANAAGGRLPVGAVPAVRAVEDVLRPLLAYVQQQGASPEELHELTGIVAEHLPGALEAYLALPEQYATTARTAGGTSPADELVEQLGLLREGAQQLATAVYDSDAQALAVGRRFLDAKFRRSDLDL